MAINIDFQDELIYITSPQTDVLVQDLVDEIRDAEDSEEGILYPKIADASGKQQLREGILVGITLELLDNWQLKFWEGAYTATIYGGNLVGGPGGDPVAYTAGVQIVLIQSANATLIELGSSPLTDDEHNRLMALPLLIDIEESSVLAKQQQLLAALGLMQHNHYIDQTSYQEYQGQQLLTSARIRIYDSAAHVGTGLGVIGKYQITSSWQNNRMQTYKVTEQAITTTTTV